MHRRDRKEGRIGRTLDQMNGAQCLVDGVTVNQERDTGVALGDEPESESVGCEVSLGCTMGFVQLSGVTGREQSRLDT